MLRFLVSATVLSFSCAVVPANAQPEAPPQAGVVTPPVVLSHVDAVYPAAAVPTRDHVDVVLAVIVDPDGNVSRVDVLESGGTALDEAATAAVRQWKFRPASRNENPIASRIRVPFHFAPLTPPQEIRPELRPEPVVPGNVVGAAVGGRAATGPSAESLGHGAVTAPRALPAPSAPEEVVIRGRSVPPSVGASDFELRVGALSSVPHQNASELLKLAPGILLTNEGGEGHAEQVFLRGFDAREGQDIEFSVGGVPINESGNLHGNGYADTHFILPEVVQRLRVVEGPFDARQGNYAVAGSADYELGVDRRGLVAKYTGGSFGTQRVLLSWGPENESVHTFAAAEAAKTEGYGQNRDAQRGSAMGQYEGQLANGSYRITGQVYTTSFHSAGVVREDDYQGGRIGFYDTYDAGQGGDSSRASIAGDVETKSGASTLAQQLFLIKRTMRLREDFTGYLLDPQTPLQQPHAQRGDLIDLDADELTLGGRGWARVHGTALGQTQQLELGYFARYDQAGGSQQRLSPATLVPYHTDTSLQSNLVDIGLYGSAELRPLRGLALVGGVRADVFSFDVNNGCAVQSVANPSRTNPPGDASCLTQQDFGAHREANQRASTVSTAVLPKASLLVGPFQHLMLSVSYGLGARSIDPNYITQDVKTPFARIQAYEAGISYAGPVGPLQLIARSIFFQTHVDRDYAFDQTVGRNVLGIGTTRTGWVGALRATASHFDESANLTLVKSTYDDTHLLVAYVPEVVFRSDTAVWEDLPWKWRGEPLRGALSAGVTYVGRRALPFSARSDTIFTVDANATAEWSHFELGLVVTNVLDTTYRLSEYNFASNFGAATGPPTLVPARLFTAGAPRGVFGTFTIRFGGG